MATLQTAPAADANRKASIVLILADDLGYGDVGCYGASTPTPHIDRLARDGVRLTQFYSNGPECSPTRTALLTGRYQQRVGGLECAIGTANVGRYDDAIRLRARNALGLPPAENTLVRLLKQAGYTVALAGKWHLGYEPALRPAAHGFDFFFGPLGGGVDYFHHTEPDGTPMLYENDRLVRREGYLTDLITEEAVKFIGRVHARPFFLYVAYTAPHTPIQGPADRRGQPMPETDWNQGTPETYAAMVRSLDRGVGRILEALAQHQLAADTLVIFTSDNGGTRLARNAPLSGHKGGLFEGGIRVPCLIRWPGRLQPGSVSDQVSVTVDLTASMVRVAGAVPSPDRAFDGLDLLAKLETKQSPEPRLLFWRARRGDTTWRAVRDDTTKYISRTDGLKAQEYLFALAEDVGEQNNLLAARPNEVTRLKSRLMQWEAEVRPAR